MSGETAVISTVPKTHVHQAQDWTDSHLPVLKGPRSDEHILQTCPKLATLHSYKPEPIILTENFHSVKRDLTQRPEFTNLTASNVSRLRRKNVKKKLMSTL
ncbi:hypothetical protein PoB_007243200 [Plakobranchus ocellatus]|uniref:Uncharacterized protein n=1 Tax=Plakobranchus ocellatus TaxID=259542 RepID=A0AAV4DNT0_9GAST|nr:hypothetical protein PoB_007243200 [Plakobranchus ocellatus]